MVNLGKVSSTSDQIMGSIFSDEMAVWLLPLTEDEMIVVSKVYPIIQAQKNKHHHRLGPGIGFGGLLILYLYVKL